MLSLQTLHHHYGKQITHQLDAPYKGADYVRISELIFVITKCQNSRFESCQVTVFSTFEFQYCNRAQYIKIIMWFFIRSPSLNFNEILRFFVDSILPERFLIWLHHYVNLCFTSCQYLFRNGGQLIVTHKSWPQVIIWIVFDLTFVISAAFHVTLLVCYANPAWFSVHIYKFVDGIVALDHTVFIFEMFFFILYVLFRFRRDLDVWTVRRRIRQ